MGAQAAGGAGQRVMLPQMSPELQARTLAEMTGASGICGVSGGRARNWSGGHTTMGAELTIGFTVTGHTRRDAHHAVSGARAGDVLILTRPIGYRGDHGRAHAGTRRTGREVTQLHWQTMQRSRSDIEAAIFWRKAHAMTDVTGFGLAGHVQAICAGLRA